MSYNGNPGKETTDERQYGRRAIITGGLAAIAGTAGGCAQALRTVESITNATGKTIETTVGAVYKTAEGGVALLANGAKVTINTIGKVITGTGKILHDWVDNGFNHYDSLDAYFYGDKANKADKSRVEAILYGVAHFLPHYVADLGRGLNATFIALPKEAMESAKEQRLKKYGPDGPNIAEGKDPISRVVRAGQGLYLLGEDTTRWLANYAGKVGKGFLVQVKEKPLDTAGKIGLTIQVIDLASNGPLDWAEHGHDGGGGGEEVPPIEPW